MTRLVGDTIINSSDRKVSELQLFMFFNWGLFIITVSAIVMLHLQIVHVEEDFLIKTFGEEYLDYRKKVCRYIGRKR